MKIKISAVQQITFSIYYFCQSFLWYKQVVTYVTATEPVSFSSSSYFQETAKEVRMPNCGPLGFSLLEASMSYVTAIPISTPLANITDEWLAPHGWLQLHIWDSQLGLSVLHVPHKHTRHRQEAKLLQWLKHDWSPHVHAWKRHCDISCIIKVCWQKSKTDGQHSGLYIEV